VIRAEPRVWHGLAASSGRAIGEASVLRGTDGVVHLPPGTILVARILHPHLGPLMCRVAGLVLEEGALLQHATVLAREFGVPAVVGVAGATQIISDGDLVEVSGGTGEVLLWSSAES